MREIINSGATTILVSHLVEQVREMCNKVLWIEKGNQIGFGDAGLLCDLYQGYLDGTVSLEEAKARLEGTGGSSATEVAERDCASESSASEPISVQKQFSSEATLELSTPVSGDETKPIAHPERSLSVDMAKAVAIGAVLLIHCSANHFARFEIGSLSWLITNFFGTVSRWAVPLFLLCSGAVMNDPDKNIPLKKLFSKYLLRLFLFLAVSSVVYEAVGVLKALDAAPLTELLAGAGRNLFYGNTHYHLYFFWFIFALYLALPLTRLVTGFASEQELRYIVLGFFLCGAVLPFLQYYSPVSQMHGSLLYFVLPAAFFCPGLGLTGWYLHCHPPKRILGSFLLFLGGFAVTFGGVWIRSRQSSILDGVYLGAFSPFIVIMAIAVFRMCQVLSARIHPNVQRGVRFLSSASFVVYLIHPFFQETLAPAWFLSLPVYVAVPLQWMMLMGLSQLAYFALHRLSATRIGQLLANEKYDMQTGSPACMRKERHTKRHIIFFTLVLAMTLGIAALAVMGEKNPPVTTASISDSQRVDDESNVPALMYHHFADKSTADTVVSGERFREHMTALRDAGYHAITVHQLIDYVDNGTPLPAKPVLITMDDGYTSNLETAAPILEELGMCATVFVIGINEGEKCYVHSGEPLASPRFAYEDAASWVEKGILDLQSHTLDMHQLESYGYSGRDGMLPLPEESEENYLQAVLEDVRQFQQRREGRVATDLCALAYPFGYCTEELDSILDEAGIIVTLTIQGHGNLVKTGDRSTLRQLGRYNVTEHMTGEALVNLLEQS